jgi:hypothetical protein
LFEAAENPTSSPLFHVNATARGVLDPSAAIGCARVKYEGAVCRDGARS